MSVFQRSAANGRPADKTGTRRNEMFRIVRQGLAAPSIDPELAMASNPTASVVALEVLSVAATGGARVLALRPPNGRALRPALDRRLERAGFAMASAVIAALDVSDHDPVHIPTVVGVLAVLAAETALSAAVVQRRAPLEMRGDWVLGGPADGILFQADGSSIAVTVWDLLVAAALDAGVPYRALPLPGSIVAQAEATVGMKPFPVYTVAPQARPRGLPRASAARLRHAMHRLAAAEGLCHPHEQALALGAALGVVIRREAQPAVLMQLAAEALIAGARLAPMPYAAG